jgi:predicted AAA+ superfamily ATPase
MSLVERQVGIPTVRLGDLLSGTKPDLTGTTAVSLDDYAREIVEGGFPAMRARNPEVNQLQFDGYLHRIVEGDFPDAGLKVRKPDALRRWMTAYAAASSTSASFETIRDAATGGNDEKPAKSTTIPYRDVLQRLWIIEEVPAWRPTQNHLRRIGSAPKHQLTDPALAARLLGVSTEALLDGQRGKLSFPRDGTLLGNLFEALATLNVRVFAQPSRAQVRHLRTKNGDHEVDIIVVRPDQRILAIEVKLTSAVFDSDVRHLNWLQREIGPDLIDGIVLTTGTEAYRRGQDGIGVVPLALLGP